MAGALDRIEAVNAISSPAVDLQLLAATHRRAFLVIDRHYRIHALNHACEHTFDIAAADAIGRPCYNVIHAYDKPCREQGLDCPHAILFANDRPESCLQVEQDCTAHHCRLHITAYPLRCTNGELYMGEMVEEISRPHRYRPGKRMEGASQAFRTCLQQLDMASSHDVPVLLQGETGTGKELAAEYIHANSRRCDKPFLTLDCTVLTETLFEAEVFGHARGAFTGSVGERVGLYELADGGTLFLDEMGELPLTQQAKLLRVLESGQFRRVGGRRVRSSDVRIICATNRQLPGLVRAGRFRDDLYYRIACMAVRVPPLRERLEDIDVLAAVLLEPISRTMHQSFRLTPEALLMLRAYDYPGNVRELRNILFEVAAHCTGEMIDSDLIAAALHEHSSEHQYALQHTDGSSGGSVVPMAGLPSESLREVEAYMISGLLEKYAFSRKRVAAAMGISERTLYRKIKRYELQTGQGGR